MDSADKVELDQIITFPNTRSTWTIIERLSPYPTPTPGNYMPVSDSFHHSYVFCVELTASGEKVVSDAIPKFAIVKMKSRFVPPNVIISSTSPPCIGQGLQMKHYFSKSRMIVEEALLNRYSLNSISKPSDAIDTNLLAEIRALEQLTLNSNEHAPKILDAKVELHLTSTRNFEVEGGAEERKHFVTYILMTEVKGACLKGDVFWSLSQEERKLIRMAFRTALTYVSRQSFGQALS